VIFERRTSTFPFATGIFLRHMPFMLGQRERKYRTRKVVKPGDLNSRNTLFGGRLLEWINEECGVYAACQMETQTLVTKSMSA